MIRQFEPKRAVEVILPAHNSYGSGYRIGGHLIITSAHLLKSLTVGSECRVRDRKNFGELGATIVWKDQKSDVALVKLPEIVEPYESVILGKLPKSDTGENLPFKMYGYPKWGRTQRSESRSAAAGMQVEGKIYLSETSADGGVVLRIGELLTSEYLLCQESEWQGMSGAAIVCEGLVIAVQRKHQRPVQTNIVEASPLWQLSDNKHWCSLLRQHGIEPEPTVVRLATTSFEEKVRATSFEKYLKSILNDNEKDYVKWDEVYRDTTVKGQQQQRLQLQVEVAQPYKGTEKGREENSKQATRTDVLTALRRYASEHVLLIGKPGSGKSTSLEQLLREEARTALQKKSGERVPVLVRLRRCTVSVEHLIRDFFIRHQLPLDISEVEWLLRQGNLLLLLDGLNELPEALRIETAKFRDRYQKTTPMIVSTRDLSLGGTLGITTKLRMLPLTKPIMKEFVVRHLGRARSKLFLQQINNDRFHKFAETPLLLSLLCQVFTQKGYVPTNLGTVFRAFTQTYIQRAQDYAPVKSKEQWPKLLQRIAFALMHNDQKLTEMKLSMSREEAEDLLTDYLKEEGRSHAREYAERWLRDLLDYQLLQTTRQPNFEEHIEFHHQLIQEYYAAEYLLRLLPELSEEQIKRDYLNLLKWTESIALMLPLIENQNQIKALLRLAEELDMKLHWRLEKDAFPASDEEKAQEAEDNYWFSPFNLHYVEYSEASVPELIEAIDTSDSHTQNSIVEALGDIGSELALPKLIQIVEDSDPEIIGNAIRALEKIGSEAAVPVLSKVLNESVSYQRDNAAEALATIGSKEAIQQLFDALEYPEAATRKASAWAIGSLEAEVAIPALLKAIIDEDYNVRYWTITRLGRFLDSEVAVSNILKAKTDPNKYVRARALNVLTRSNSDCVISVALQLITDPEPEVRASAAEALGTVKYELAAPELTRALKDTDKEVRLTAAMALAGFGSDTAIPELLKAIENPHIYRHKIVDAIGDINSEAAILEMIKLLMLPEAVAYVSLRFVGMEVPCDPLYVLIISKLADINIPFEKPALALINMLNHPDSRIREEIIKRDVLKNITAEAVAPRLVQLSKHSDKNIRAGAIKALGNIASKEVALSLIKATEDPVAWVRATAARALVGLDSKTAVPVLCKLIEDVCVRTTAIRMLSQVGSDEAVAALTKIVVSPSEKYDHYKEPSSLLDKREPSVREQAISALGRTGSDTAIQTLIDAIGYPNEHSRKAAARALRDFEYEKIIDYLPYLQKTCRSFVVGRYEVQKTISSIQNQCRFYDYATFQSLMKSGQ